MKKILLFVLLVSSQFLFAQSLKRANSYLQKHELASAVAVINTLIEMDSMNPAAHFMKARIYSDIKYPAHDFFLAFKCINICDQQFGRLNVLEQDKIRDYVDASQIDFNRKLIEARLIEWIKSSNSPAITSRFIAECTESTYNSMAIELLRKQEYQITLNNNSIDAYENFITKYPESTEAKNAYLRIVEIDYNRTKINNSTNAFKEFIKRYPESAQAAEAYKIILEREYELVLKINTDDAIHRFIKKYPDSKQAIELKNYREQTEYQQLSEIPTLEAYNRFLNNYPNHPERSRMAEIRDSLAYKKAISENTTEAYMNFISNYPNAIQVAQIIEKQKQLSFSWEELQQQRLDLFYASKNVQTMRIFKVLNLDSSVSVPYEKYTFRKNGKLLSYILFDEDGKYQEDYLYSEISQKPEYLLIHKNGIETDKIKNEYNSENLLVKSTSLNNRNISFFDYGTKRNCLHKTTISEISLDTMVYIEFNYINSFIPSEKIILAHSDNSNQKTKESYFYNANGILLQTIKFNTENSVISVKTYQYNSVGKLIKEIFQDISGTETRLYSYNGYGLIDEVKVTHNSLPLNNFLLKYTYLYFDLEE